MTRCRCVQCGAVLGVYVQTTGAPLCCGRLMVAESTNRTAEQRKRATPGGGRTEPLRAVLEANSGRFTGGNWGW